MFLIYNMILEKYYIFNSIKPISAKIYISIIFYKIYIWLRGCPSVQNDKKKIFCIYLLFHNINKCSVF